MVGIYARVSTSEQAMNGYSIEEQQDRAKKYAEAMNWDVYDVYVDAGFSGGNTDRPALQKLIRDVRSGKLDRVLVYKLDRLSRSQKDTLMLIEDVFLKNGADFVSMSENFDTSSSFGRAMIGMLAVFAQLEREQIKERMSMGADARAKKGKYCSPNSPIGYDYHDGELFTNEYEKIQIQRIYALYLQGKSFNAITDGLNAAGFTHKYGIWKYWSVRHILMTRLYLGENYFRGEWRKGSHEAFVTEEVWQQVQEIRERKAEEHRKYNRRLGLASSYLSGYLVCGRCGAKYGKYTRHSIDGKKTYFNYKCNSVSKRNPKTVRDPNCHNVLWNMEELDSLVFGEIRKLALDPDYVSPIAENEADDRPALQKEISKIEAQMNRLMDLYSLGDMPKDSLQEKIKKLNDQKFGLEKEIEKISAEKKKLHSAAEVRDAIDSFGFILDHGSFDEIREAIGLLINKIVIDGRDITIYWNFS